MHVETVKKVIKHFEILLTVEHVFAGLPRRRKMPAAHVRFMIGLVTETL